jgi:catechol 2,3-dioxygenase-like lactoylglutathione lyase family enzyme
MRTKAYETSVPPDDNAEAFADFSRPFNLMKPLKPNGMTAHVEVYSACPLNFKGKANYVDAANDYVPRIHLVFQARSRENVDTFHRLALEAGGRSNGAPGLRPYHDRYYAAFVFDPDGNNIEAVCNAPGARNVDSVIVERT